MRLVVSRGGINQSSANPLQARHIQRMAELFSMSNNYWHGRSNRATSRQAHATAALFPLPKNVAATELAGRAVPALQVEILAPAATASSWAPAEEGGRSGVE